MLTAYVGGIAEIGLSNSAITSGAPGVSVSSAPSGYTISQVQLGPWDSIAPNSVNAATIGASSYPNNVDLQWQGVTDESNGTGVWIYQVYRQDSAHPSHQFIGSSYTPSFSDPTLRRPQLLHRAPQSQGSRLDRPLQSQLQLAKLAPGFRLHQ
jgi:hypothetical protein